MLILLVRHAQAAEQDDEKYPDDTERPLVPSGRRVQRRISRLLRKQGIVPERVYSSPWTRAWQTARILQREMGLGKDQRIRCDSLATVPDAAAIAAEVGEQSADATIALVGHEPWMSDLAAQLLTGSSSGIRVDFPKSGVMGIEMDALQPAGGTLRFFVVP
jgi:phosphohistidine phosphatase